MESRYCTYTVRSMPFCRLTSVRDAATRRPEGDPSALPTVVAAAALPAGNRAASLGGRMGLSSSSLRRGHGRRSHLQHRLLADGPRAGHGGVGAAGAGAAAIGGVRGLARSNGKTSLCDFSLHFAIFLLHFAIFIAFCDFFIAFCDFYCILRFFAISLFLK